MRWARKAGSLILGTASSRCAGCRGSYPHPLADRNSPQRADAAVVTVTPPPPAGAVSGRPRFISDAVMGLEKSAVVPSDHARNCRFKPQSDSLKLSALKNFDIDSPSCSEPESFPCHCSLASRLSPPDKRFRSMRIVNVTMPPADDTCVYDPLHRVAMACGPSPLGSGCHPHSHHFRRGR